MTNTYSDQYGWKNNLMMHKWLNKLNKITKASTGKNMSMWSVQSTELKNIAINLLKLAKMVNLKDKIQIILEDTTHAYIHNRIECKAWTTFRLSVTLHSPNSYLIMWYSCMQNMDWLLTITFCKDRRFKSTSFHSDKIQVCWSWGRSLYFTSTLVKHEGWTRASYVEKSKLFYKGRSFYSAQWYVAGALF
jgi:hypothetical protein